MHRQTCNVQSFCSPLFFAFVLFPLRTFVANSRCVVSWILTNTEVFRPFAPIRTLAAKQPQRNAVLNWSSPQLLDEAGDVLFPALAQDRSCPRKVELPSTVAAFAANDDPINAAKVDLAYVLQKRFEG